MYTVVKEFEFEGTAYAVDQEVEFTDEVATPLLEAGNIVKTKGEDQAAK